MDVEKLCSIGLELGYEGHDLRDWISSQQEIQRDEEKVRQDKELEMKAMELKQKEREWEEKRKEREEIEKENAHRRKMELLQAQATAEKATVGQHNNTPSPLCYQIEMAQFDDSVDEMDAYLLRFERTMSAHRVPKDVWALELSQCLKGEALSMYGRLSYEEAMDYDSLKNELSLMYNLTADGYRHRFDESLPHRYETTKQFATRLRHYLRRWIELSEVDNTAEGISDLLVREQIIKLCNNDLSTFVKLRTPTSTKEMSALVDKYISAHGEYGFASAICSPNIDIETQGSVARASRDAQQENQSTNLNVHRKTEYSPQRAQISIADTTQDRLSEYTSDDNLPVLAANCVTGDRLPVCSGVVHGQLVSIFRATDSDATTICERLVSDKDFLGTQKQCVTADGTWQMFPEVRVHIDTPFFIGFVDALAMSDPAYDVILGNVEGARGSNDPDPDWRSNVHKNQRLIDRNNFDNSHDSTNANSIQNRNMEPGHTVFNDTPSRELTPKVNSSIAWWAIDSDTPNQFEQTGYVTGYSFSKAGSATNNKSQKIHPALCRLSPSNERHTVTFGELVTEQRNDPSLCNIWARIENQENTHANRCPVVLRNGVINRIYTSKNGKVWRQIVVPTKFRNNVLQKYHVCVSSGHVGYRQMLRKVSMMFYWPSIQRDIARYVRSCNIMSRESCK